MIAYNNLKALLRGLRRNVPLKRYTTFKIGGPAKYFFIAKTKEDIVKAACAAKQIHLPFFILGGGSNLLVSDKGFNGLVINIANCKWKIENSFLYAEAGVPVATLVRETGKRGLSGLEWAGGLPGTLGGAIRGNAGAFGGEIKDSIVWVEALDGKLRLRRLRRTQCQFDYRSSLFKKRGWIVVAALMRFGEGDKKQLRAIAHDHIRYRKDRHPLEYPNAGSIFKNCDLNKVPKNAKKLFLSVVKRDPFPVIPAAAIIAQSRLKGRKVGGARVSEKHPNFIINMGNAQSQDVLSLMRLIERVVKKKFGIHLEREIQLVGF